GRSNIVGKPLAQLLLAENATVTVAHSKTRELAAVCRRADLLFAAGGRAGKGGGGGGETGGPRPGAGGGTGGGGGGGAGAPGAGGGRGGRGRDLAGAGRRRSDDHCVPARQHRAGGLCDRRPAGAGVRTTPGRGSGIGARRKPGNDGGRVSEGDTRLLRPGEGDF